MKTKFYLLFITDAGSMGEEEGEGVWGDAKADRLD